jgi:hypothetical protein
MKMGNFSCALFSYDWHRQAYKEQIWMMFYRSFKEPIFVLDSTRL